MPKPQPPTETVEFNGLVDQVAESLSFGDKERLGAFIRNMIEKTLVFLESKNHEKVSFDQVVYSLVNITRRLGAKLEIRVLVPGNDPSEPKDICSIALKETEYKGFPDGSPRSSTGLMVNRKRISVVDVKNAKKNLWTSASAVLKKRKEEHDPASHLDVQVKP